MHHYKSMAGMTSRMRKNSRSGHGSQNDPRHISHNSLIFGSVYGIAVSNVENHDVFFLDVTTIRLRYFWLRLYKKKAVISQKVYVWGFMAKFTFSIGTHVISCIS